MSYQCEGYGCGEPARAQTVTRRKHALMRWLLVDEKRQLLEHAGRLQGALCEANRAITLVAAALADTSDRACIAAAASTLRSTSDRIDAILSAANADQEPT